MPLLKNNVITIYYLFILTVFIIPGYCSISWQESVTFVSPSNKFQLGTLSTSAKTSVQCPIASVGIPGARASKGSGGIDTVFCGSNLAWNSGTVPEPIFSESWLNQHSSSNITSELQISFQPKVHPSYWTPSLHQKIWPIQLGMPWTSDKFPADSNQPLKINQQP